MKCQIDLENRTLQLLSTTEEDKQALFEMEQKLNQEYGRGQYGLKGYSLIFHSADSTLNKLKKGEVESLIYNILVSEE